MILIILLLLCISSATSLFCQFCFNRQKINAISQFSMLMVFLICVISPLFLNMHSSWNFQLPIFSNLQLSLSLYFDSLTWAMISLVSFISLIIHSYAARYLMSDPNQKRFMGQLSLLTFSVMLLMMSGSLFTAFIAWQFIGLSLYLLLNHYHYDIRANKSAKKKFMINRVGDISFLLAVVVALHQYGSTEFSVLFAHSSNINPLILILIFVAIMTKSAQFPFHIWLVDTMEAPTPVSALMHAGVINAGGFLLARLSPLYGHFYYLMLFIFLVGLVTALLGNFFMQNQADVKKQLAYSTMGQMGYMVMQCGLGCFSSAVFHLIAHGFFKATLFLSSGSTLKQSNQPTLPSQRKRANNYAKSAFSLCLTVILIGLGILYFSQAGHSNLNPLLWFFIAISLFQLIRRGLVEAKNIKTQGMLIISSIFVFVIYLLLLNNFNVLLGNSIAEQTLPQLGWISTFTLLFLIVLGFLFLKFLPSRHQKNLCYKIYLFGLYKGSVERSYRQYLINPIRLWGDKLLHIYQKLNKGLKYSLVMLVLLYLVASSAYAITRVHDHLSSMSMTILLISLLLFLFILIIANRVKTLPRILITLLLSMLTMTSIAFATGSKDMAVMASFHCINSLLIIAGFSTLLLRRYKPNPNPIFLQNRLPWCHFYMSTFLILFIGIPGSSSFISEFYLLYNLIHIHFLLAVLLSVGMLLLTLVILHTLQVHFFNPNAIRQYTTPVSTVVHVMCCFIIGFNLFNGFYPEPFLQTLSSLIGGY